MTFIKLSAEHARRARHMLATLPQLQELPCTALRMLLMDAAWGRLAAGETLFDQGQPADHWYLVMSGRIDTLRYGRDGEERVIQHIGSGQWLAPIVMFSPQRSYPVSARGVQASEICRLRRDRLHQACLAHPRLALQVLELAAQALTSRIDDVDSLAGGNASQRLAGYLLRQSEIQGTYVRLPLTQRNLAASLGIRPETLSRLLSEWRKQGYLQGQRGLWQISDPQAFKDLSYSFSE